MTLRKGMRVKTLSSTVGREPRHGVIKQIHGDTVEVQWNDGHNSVLSGATLVPDHEKRSA